MKNSYLIVGVVLAVIVVLVGASYSLSQPHTIPTPSPTQTPPIIPTPSPTQNNHTHTVRIAVSYILKSSNYTIWPHEIDAEIVEKLVETVETEINGYCEQYGYLVRFNFTILPVKYDRQDAHPGLPEVKDLKARGINFVVGLDTAMLIHGAYDYINGNNMIMLSPAGGSTFTTQDDNFFTLIPPESSSGEALAALVNGLGYRAFVAAAPKHIQLGEETVNKIAEAISFNNSGSWVFYDVNAQNMDGMANDVSKKLTELENTYGRGRVCILAEPRLSSAFLDALEAYPVLSNATWFDVFGIPEEKVMEELPLETIAKYEFIRAVPWPGNSSLSDNFLREYREKVSELPTPSQMYLQAARRDAMWLLALSVLEAESLEPLDVKPVLLRVSRSFDGVLGNCTFDEYGSRTQSDMSFFGWTKVDNAVEFQLKGFYNSATREYVIIDARKMTIQ